VRTLRRLRRGESESLSLASITTVATTAVPGVENRIRGSVVVRSGIETFIIGAAVLAVGGIVATRLRYVPMWDGYEYASAINRAAAPRSNAYVDAAFPCSPLAYTPCRMLASLNIENAR